MLNKGDRFYKARDGKRKVHEVKELYYDRGTLTAVHYSSGLFKTKVTINKTPTELEVIYLRNANE